MTTAVRFNSINSRYNKTTLYEVNLNKKVPSEGQVIFYGTTVLPILKDTVDDFYITLKREHIGRFDLISYDQYGTPELWWVIAIANNIIDIFDESAVGSTIRIPPMYEVSSILGVSV